MVSKYCPPLNVQHIPSSVGKKEKYCMHGSESPNQLQSRTKSSQAGAVFFLILYFKYYIKKYGKFCLHTLFKILNKSRAVMLRAS